MVQRMNSAFSFAHGQGKVYWFDGTLMEIKATGKETNDAFSLIEGQLPAGHETPMIKKTNEEDVFYVLEGEITFTLGEETIVGNPGTFIYAPRGTQYKMKVGESSPAKILIMFTPAGVEQLYVEFSERAQEMKLPPVRKELDLGKFAAAAQSYGIEILG